MCVALMLTPLIHTQPQTLCSPGAVSKSIVNVSVCPEAYWKRSDPSADAITADATINEKIKPTQRSICRDERASVSAFAYGSPPLTVTYFRKVGGRQPTNITVTNVDEQYAYSAVRSLHTASAFVVDIDLGEFEKAQNYEYFITKVEWTREKRSISYFSYAHPLLTGY